MARPGGAVAAGHPETARVAAEILAAGGNAFDAVIGAHLAACVAEPILASLGGGGFLLARTTGDVKRIYDFFVQSPMARREGALDFKPVHGDFGDAQQEFHVGAASIATPGCIAGLAAIHEDLGRMPLKAIVQPAIALANSGVVVNEFQAFLMRVLEPILLDNQDVGAFYGVADGQLMGAGGVQKFPELAESIAAFGAEGAEWFYAGDPGQRLVRICREYGGHLAAADLAAYTVERREPLRFAVGGAAVYTNPVPSCGGSLVAYLTRLLDSVHDAGETLGGARLAAAMAQTSRARKESGLDILADLDAAARLLDDAGLAQAAAEVRRAELAIRGTTHISVVDADGNLATMTISNGEGSGIVLDDWGIHLNNMLGEEDLNPRGFHRWRPDRRLVSMMAPTIVEHADGTMTALGSGGSNRIRTALGQVLARLLVGHEPLDQAITAPRMHFESGHLHVEPGWPPDVVASLQQDYPEHCLWGGPNLYFGGVHAVQQQHGRTRAFGDPRRGGVGRAVRSGS